MAKPVYILGTGLSHDGSSCLLKDGKIVVAIEKERITKKKHDGANDDLTINYCLDAEGITFKDISLVVEENTLNPQLRPEDIIARGKRIIPDDIPRVCISHHLAHAYSAVGCAPFDQMAVMVIDGEGSSLDTCIDINQNSVLPEEIKSIAPNERYLFWEKMSYYHYKDGILQTVFKDFSEWYRSERNILSYNKMEHSLGEFYDSISYYVFNEDFCAGKLMGLAPFGRPNIFNFEAFEYHDNRVFIKTDWINNFDPYLGSKYQCFSEYFQYYADVAYWAQRQLEKALSYIFNACYDMMPSENIGYAGGVALNAVANAYLLKNTRYSNFYFQPAAGDNGLAIGCCYYGWLKVLEREKIKHNASTYFGRTYQENDIKMCLSDRSSKINYYRGENYILDTAKLLNDGKTIAWFQDGSEFGPRALGHRSILADPRRKDIKNFINRKIKSREDFRPFAPSVLLEDSTMYFDCTTESPYMILVAQTKDEWQKTIPGVVHKDGSARIQTVTKDLNNKYYQLITEFKKLSGVSILLNTSFNGRGMPIVETVEDAVEFFIKAKELDALVIQDYIITRK